MFKIDLHTHSIASPDGGISGQQYEHALTSGKLDAIAITDHNTTEFALQMQKQLGERIIVGEEIMTTRGEIIGLYLSQTVPSGLSPAETIQHIKMQGGIVYIPHPFETIRSGLSAQTLEEITKDIDLIEICNGRAFMQNRSSQTVVWSRLNNVVGAASSDAHGSLGLGKTYSSLSAMPTKETLVELLQRATHHTGRPGARTLLYPKYHKLRKKIRKSK